MGIIPCLGGNMLMAGSGGITLSYVDYAHARSTSAGTNTCTGPSTAQSGDLCICFEHVYGGTYGGSTPTGYTELGYYAGAGHSTPRMRISGKVLISADVSAAVNGITMTLSAYGWRAMTLAIFRPTGPIVSFSAGAAFSSEGTSGEPVAQTISISGVTDRPVLSLYMGGTSFSSTYSYAGMTAPYTNVLDTYAYQIKNTGESTSNITADMVDGGGNNGLMSGYVLVSG